MVCVQPGYCKVNFRQKYDILLIIILVPEEENYGRPIMTAALSHLGKFHPDMPGSMVQYASGARMSGAVHWIGMGSDEEFEAVTATGARTIRIIKP